MSLLQITCITKPQQGGHEHITHAGNPAANWWLTVEQIIARIDAKSQTFFVEDPRTGKRAYVGVVRPQGHAPYIRTYADGVWTDNLLSLVACPWRAAA